MAKITKVPQPRTWAKCQKMTQNDNFFFLAYSYIFCTDIISEQKAAYRIEKHAKTWKLWPILGASVAEWLESRTHDHLPLTAVGSNPVMGVRIFQVRKPPSWLAEGRWFYPGVDLGLISLKR